MLSLLATAQGTLFEGAIQPALFALHLMAYADLAYTATGFLLIGLCELALAYALLRPLEALWPAERWTRCDERHVDFLYSVLHKLGVIPLVLFVLVVPAQNQLDEYLLGLGFMRINLDQFIFGLQEHPLATFLLYAVVFDVVEYWAHRGQHYFRWWWALHSLHHSQRQMTLWTEDRNHFLDDLLSAIRLALLASIVGVPPGQFVLAAMAIRLVQNLAHANLRIGFGPGGEYLLVSPRYHRVHHAIGLGHEGRALGCNFANLFPLWDVLFGTANFTAAYPPTGIRNQLKGANYGSGLVKQQLLGVRRLVRSLLPAAGQPTPGVSD